MRNETADILNPGEMKFVQARNGERFYSESEILDLIECAVLMGLDSEILKMRVAELERVVAFPV